MRIYTVSGKATHGKSTIANFIKEIYETHYNKKVCILANADYLKFLAKSYLGWSGNKDEEGRKLLQEFGTEHVRYRMGEDFWVDTVIDQINILKGYYDVFVIADTRFPNEINKLEKEFGIEYVTSLNVIKSNHSGVPVKTSLTEEQLNHPSEIALNDYHFDEIIYNFNGSLDYTKESIRAIVWEYEV